MESRHAIAYASVYDHTIRSELAQRSWVHKHCLRIMQPFRREMHRTDNAPVGFDNASKEVLISFAHAQRTASGGANETF